jgi:hypothetical protein
MSTRRSSGDIVRAWLPNNAFLWALGAWVIISVLYVALLLPIWSRASRQTNCPVPRTFAAPLTPDQLGLPASGATLAASLGIARGVVQDSVSWPAGPGAPTHVAVMADSSALLHSGGGRVVPSDAVTAWLSIDNGTAVLTDCVDSRKAQRLSNGTFAGFASVHTTDPARTITVREQLSVQSTYAADFWVLGLLIIPFGIALAWDKLKLAGAAGRWLATIIGTATFVGAYYTSALSNPGWGGLKATGTLLVTLFTTTTGAIATAAATTRRT